MAAIPFLVDSGAAQTIVHPKDSIRRLGLSVPQLVNRGLWANVVENVGIGGQAVSFECPARYAFQDTAGQWRITDGNIRIAELTPGNQHLPSLLGWDLLRKFKTTILGNPQEISLEWL